VPKGKETTMPDNCRMKVPQTNWRRRKYFGNQQKDAQATSCFLCTYYDKHWCTLHGKEVQSGEWCELGKIRVTFYANSRTVPDV